MRRTLAVALTALLAAPVMAALAKPPVKADAPGKTAVPAKAAVPETVTCADGFRFQLSGQRGATFVLESPVTLQLPGEKPQTLVREAETGVGEARYSNADWTYFEYRLTRGLENRRDRKLSHDCPP